MPYTTERINTVCLIILASVATVMALIYTRIVLVPFVIAIFLFAVLLPIIEFIENKLKVQRWFAVSIVFLILGLMTFATWLLLFQSVKGFLVNIDVYKLKAIEFVQEASIFGSSFGFKINPNLIQEEIQNLPVLYWLRDFSGFLASFVGSSFLICVFVIFLLVGEKATKIPEESIWHNLEYNISRYIIIKFLSSFVCALLVFPILYFCGVELAFLFSFITFLLNFIPNIGAVIAAILPLPLIILNNGFGWQFFVVLIMQTVILSVIGTVVEPKLLGERMGLHPIAILMFLIFWGLVWGIPGMFLAVPITSVLRIIFSKIEATKSFSELLSGKIS
jgi:AI-2 transport protein TqsA